MTLILIGSIKVDEDQRQAYSLIVKALENVASKIYHEHITETSQEQLDKMSDDEKIEFHNRILKQVKNSDVVVAEVTHPSMGVGFLIANALDFQKPTILLYQKDAPTNLLTNLERNERLIAIKYDVKSDLKKLLGEAIEYAAEKQDVRFNFFVSPEIQQYLDWVAKYKRTPRAVYLRELLERDMKENKDWKKQK
jgi:hypothetical protein